MAEEKNDLKTIISINKTTKEGAIVNAEDYKTFVSQLAKAPNVADLIGGAEKLIEQKLEAGKDIKRVVDAVAKVNKQAGANIREYITRYMDEGGIKKLEGVLIKSITFQDEVEGVETVAKKQIKLGKSYVDLDEVSKDELVEALEAKGIKTRLQSSEVKKVKPASVRIQK